MDRPTARTVDRRLTMPPDLLHAENKRLQRCVRDLVSVMALPASWIGHELSDIVGTVLDTVLGMLDLDFVHLHLINVSGNPPLVEMPLSHRAGCVAALQLQQFGALLIPAGACAGRFHGRFSRATARQPGAYTGQPKRRPGLRPG